MILELLITALLIQANEKRQEPIPHVQGSVLRGMSTITQIPTAVKGAQGAPFISYSWRMDLDEKLNPYKRVWCSVFYGECNKTPEEEMEPFRYSRYSFELIRENGAIVKGKMKYHGEAPQWDFYGIFTYDNGYISTVPLGGVGIRIYNPKHELIEEQHYEPIVDDYKGLQANWDYSDPKNLKIHYTIDEKYRHGWEAHVSFDGGRTWTNLRGYPLPPHVVEIKNLEEYEYSFGIGAAALANPPSTYIPPRFRLTTSMNLELIIKDFTLDTALHGPPSKPYQESVRLQIFR